MGDAGIVLMYLTYTLGALRVSGRLCRVIASCVAVGFCIRDIVKCDVLMMCHLGFCH